MVPCVTRGTRQSCSAAELNGYAVEGRGLWQRKSLTASIYKQCPKQTETSTAKRASLLSSRESVDSMGSYQPRKKPIASWHTWILSLYVYLQPYPQISCTEWPSLASSLVSMSLSFALYLTSNSIAPPDTSSTLGNVPVSVVALPLHGQPVLCAK